MSFKDSQRDENKDTLLDELVGVDTALISFLKHRYDIRTARQIVEVSGRKKGCTEPIFLAVEKVSCFSKALEAARKKIEF